MSIDARIIDVVYRDDGKADLKLEAADTRRAPAGQLCITIENPRPGLRHLIGEHVWGGSRELMIGQAKFADRLGYTRARLPEGQG